MFEIQTFQMALYFQSKKCGCSKIVRNLAWIKFIEWPSKNFFRQFIIRNIIIENNLSIDLNSILVALCHPFIYCKYYKIYSIPFNLKRLNYQKFQYAFFYNFTDEQLKKFNSHLNCQLTICECDDNKTIERYIDSAIATIGSYINIMSNFV